MERMTLYVPDEFKKSLEKHPDINWPEVMKQGILKKLEKMEKFEKLMNRRK